MLRINAALPARHRNSTTSLSFGRARERLCCGIDKRQDLQLHLELAGGLTGDMFLAAVLDAFPQFEDRVAASIDAVEEACAVVCFDVVADDRLGRREAKPSAKYFDYNPLAVAHEPVNFSSVCDRLIEASIDQAVRAHSKNLLHLLAEAESAAHAIEPAGIELQVGAWDAIADIVGAATLIDALDTAHWSASPVAVPEGMTPTGTAILRYLCPSGGSAVPRTYALVGSGTGFPSRSRCPRNPVRVLCFDEAAESPRSRIRANRARIQPGSSRRH